MGDAVDLDHMDSAVRGRRQPEARAVDRDPAGVRVEPLDLDVRRVGSALSPDLDGKALRPGLRDAHAVAGAAQLEVEWPTRVVLYLGAAAARGRQQPLNADLFLVFVGLDRGGGECDGGVLVRGEAPFAADPVDPAGVGRSVDDLGRLQQVEHEALVGGAAFDDHGGLGHRAAQPPEGLLPVTSVSDDLRDHRVEVGGDRVALADPGVDPDARPGGQREPCDAPGRGREVTVRVLGVQPRLDRVPGLKGLSSLEATAARHVQLQPHQVGAGGQLGDRVLDLQPGVDFEEGEPPLPRVVEELDGGGPLVADGQCEPLGRRLQVVGLLPDEHRRRRFLDDLLVAPLHRAVADPEGPGGALPVGDDLDLDVPGSRDQALKEHGAAAERAQRLGAGPLERLGEVPGRRDDPDAAPAAAGSGLEHQRVADALRRGQGVLQRRDRAPAPRRDGDADLLGDQLRADFGAQLAHRVGRRPDERDTDLLAHLGERGVLGDEAPADPGGVGPGLDKRAFEHGVVEVRPRGGGPQGVGQIGFPHKGGGAVRVGVQGHRLDRRSCLCRQIPDGVDQPHGCLTTVDDGDTAEHERKPPSVNAEGDAPDPERRPQLRLSC